MRVYTFLDVDILKKEVEGQDVYKKELIEVFALEMNFLSRLGESLGRDNGWDVLRDDDELSVTAAGGVSYTSALTRHQLTA